MIALGIILIFFSFYSSIIYSSSSFQRDLNTPAVGFTFIKGFDFGNFISLWSVVGLFLILIFLFNLEYPLNKKILILVLIILSMAILMTGYYLLISNAMSVSLSDCNNYQEKYNREWCYSELAKINDDISICNKITEDQMKNRCLYEFN